MLNYGFMGASFQTRSHRHHHGKSLPVMTIGVPWQACRLKMLRCCFSVQFAKFSHGNALFNKQTVGTLYW